MVHRSVFNTAVNEGRGYRCRCTFLERGDHCRNIIVAVLYFHFITLHSTDAKVNFPGKSTRFLTFSTNHRRESTVLLLSRLLLHSVFHHFLDAQKATKAAIFDASVG